MKVVPDEPSSSLGSRCDARSWAASRCSLRKTLSEGYWGIMCFPTARICDATWVAGPHRDASPVLGPHRGFGFRWFIDFFLSRSISYHGIPEDVHVHVRGEIPPRAPAARGGGGGGAPAGLVSPGSALLYKQEPGCLSGNAIRVRCEGRDLAMTTGPSCRCSCGTAAVGPPVRLCDESCGRAATL